MVTMKTEKVLVEGIVQGVGFRPFVYRIATELELTGYVRNLGNVVEIIIQNRLCQKLGKCCRDNYPRFR